MGNIKSLECQTCKAVGPDCAYGELIYTQSCEDAKARFSEALKVSEDDTPKVLIVDDSRNRAILLHQRLQEAGLRLLKEKHGGEDPEVRVLAHVPDYIGLDTIEHDRLERMAQVLVSDNVIIERPRDPGKSRTEMMLKTFKELYGSDLGEDLTGEHHGPIPGMRPRNPALDSVALKMKAIRLLNREGIKKPSQEQIKQKMEELSNAS